MELDPELALFIASWQRMGLSEEQIAKKVARHIRLAKRYSDDDAGDPSLLDENLGELPDEPGSPGADHQSSNQSPELQAAIAKGMQVIADPSNEPKKTRDAPRCMRPRFGRPAIDINAPNVKRMLERLRPRSLAEIAAIKPPQWLIARHIPENSLIALFGRFSTCKSFLAMSWSLSIASGKSWLGRRARPGHVFYISAEGTAGIVKRAMAFCKENGLEELPEKFHAITGSVAMNDPAILDYLAIVIRQTLKAGEKPSLIVIDTLNRCFGGGDENSTKDMSAFVAGCDAMREEFGASVLIIHHTGHDSSKGSRGATSLPSAMDMAFLLVKPKGSSLAILKNEDPAKPHKDSAPLPDQALEFVEVEIDGLEPNEDDPHATTSLVVRAANAERAAEVEQARAAKRRSGADETFDAIRACADGITLADLVNTTGKPRSTIRSQCSRLRATGRMRQEGERYIAVGDADGDETSLWNEVKDVLAMQTRGDLQP